MTQQRPEVATELAEARERAYEAAKRAIELDQTWKEVLRGIWAPNSPGKDVDENDLESLHDEPGVKAQLS